MASNRKIERPRNYFFLNNGKIIGKVAYGKEGLEAERAWMLHLRSRADPTKVVLPQPIGPIVQEGEFFCLYMIVIPGQTLEQWIANNGGLTEELARKVADAYLALRAVPVSPSDHLIPGGLPWPVMGQMFNEDNEAEYVASSRSDFSVMMDERLRVAVGPKAKLPRAGFQFAHGDISPTNILLTPNDRIAFVDFGMSAWLPEYWDAFNLTLDNYAHPPGFLGPIRKAFAEKGITMNDDHIQIQLRFFAAWSKSQKGRQYLR